MDDPPLLEPSLRAAGANIRRGGQQKAAEPGKAPQEGTSASADEICGWFRPRRSRLPDVRGGAGQVDGAGLQSSLHEYY